MSAYEFFGICLEFNLDRDKVLKYIELSALEWFTEEDIINCRLYCERK